MAAAVNPDPATESALVAEAAPHFEWDTATWSRALSVWGPDLLTREKTGRPLRCLEVGARRGGLSAWLASRGHHCLATDLSMPERPNHSGTGRVEVAALDLVGGQLDELFDVIVVKSVLGSVRAVRGEAGLRSAQANLVEMLADDGAIWFAENLSASRLHRGIRRRFVAWSDRWHYFTPDELQAALSPGCSVEGFATTGVTAVFGRTENQRRHLARLDAALETVVPEGARYVGYGVARKLARPGTNGTDAEGRVT